MIYNTVSISTPMNIAVRQQELDPTLGGLKQQDRSPLLSDIVACRASFVKH